MSSYGIYGNYGKRKYMTNSPKAMAFKKLKAVIKGVGRRNRIPKSKIKGAIAPYGGRQELKYVDTDLASGENLYDSTGFAECLNLIAVGDDNTSRDGRQVTIKSVQVKGLIQNFDATTGPSRARTMLVWDNANNSASTSAATLIAAVLTSASPYAFPLVDNQNRFTILWDSNEYIGGINTTATQTYAQTPVGCVIDVYKKINQVTQYSGTTAAIGSIQNGALWLITIGNQSAGAGAVLNGQARVRFTDN